MLTPRKIAARKVAVLYLLDAPNAAGNEPSPVEGTTKLQKLLFLVQDLHGEGLDRAVWDVDFAYVPEKFGPADLELYQDLDFLEVAGNISSGHLSQSAKELTISEWASTERTGPLAFPEEKAEEELSFEYLMSPNESEFIEEQSSVEKVYSITDRGRHILERLESVTDPAQKRELGKLREACRTIKMEYGSWPLKRLLEFVYRNYESMLSESTIRDRVLGQE